MSVFRTLVLLLLLLSPFPAADLPKQLDASYTISYAFFDDIAETTLRFESDGRRYRIVADAWLKGIAASLARHHREHHESEGIVTADGRLLPLHYRSVRRLDRFRMQRRYTFDHRHRQVLLTQTVDRNVTKRTFDRHRLRWVEKTDTTRKTGHYRMNFYAKDDLLTLYFNARKLLAGREGKPLKIPAVGSRNGLVTLERIADISAGGLLDSPANALACRVLIDQDIFRSKKGELFVGLDANLLVNEAVLKDVFLFGDLHVRRKR